MLMVQYPALRDVIRSVASKVLSESLEGCTSKMAELIEREKDPFTLNDFLQQRVNKIKLDEFNAAVDRCFENARTPASDWGGLKEEIYTGMQQWYRQTHRCICSQLAIKGCSFHVPCLLGTLYFTPIVGMISYLTNSYQMLNLNALMLLFGSRSSSDKNKNHDFEIIQSCSSQYFTVLQRNKYYNSNDTI